MYLMWVALWLYQNLSRRLVRHQLGERFMLLWASTCHWATPVCAWHWLVCASLLHTDPIIQPMPFFSFKLFLSPPHTMKNVQHTHASLSSHTLTGLVVGNQHTTHTRYTLWCAQTSISHTRVVGFIR